MQLIETILQELTDVNLSLASPLLKTKLLASRIGNTELLSWVNNELAGYKDRKDLPDYRVEIGDIVGEYINGTMHVSNQPLPLPPFEDKFERTLRTFELYDGVESLEKLTEASGTLVRPFDQKQVRMFHDLLAGNPGTARNFSLLNVGVSTSVNISKGVLNAVRNKLMDFMIALEQQFGIQVQMETLQSNRNIINNIMNTTITNNGDGNINNTGNDSTTNATVNILKGKKDSLEKTLRENHINKDDIDALIQVIDEEEPSGKNFGKKVNAWIQSMIAKSLDGSWQVGVGAAGTLLAEAITKYYGM